MNEFTQSTPATEPSVPTEVVPMEIRHYAIGTTDDGREVRLEVDREGNFIREIDEVEIKETDNS